MTVEYFHERGEKIDFVCKVLGLNRSSYYKWKNRTQPKKELQDQEICELIKEYQDTKSYDLKRLLCDLTETSYYTSNEELLNNLKNRI